MSTSTSLKLLLVCAPFIACSEASQGSTTGRRVNLSTEMVVEPAAADSFVNHYGWKVSLTTALISIGPIYYFDGAPMVIGQGPPPRPLYHRVTDWFSIKTAHAHPGHYVAGAAVGEMRTSYSVDLAGGVTPLPQGHGISGHFRSARFSFEPNATGPHANRLSGHAVVLEGVAGKGEDARAFRAVVDASDLHNTKSEPIIEGCPFDEAQVARDGTVRITLKPTIWFDRVSFDTVGTHADGSPADIDRESIAFKALVRGLKSAAAYAFTYRGDTR